MPVCQGTSRMRSVALSTDGKAACGCDGGEIKVVGFFFIIIITIMLK